MSTFDYVVDRGGEHTRAVLSGELDAADHERLRRLVAQLEPDLAGTVVLDCRSLAFLDARGATLLSRLARRAVDQGGRLVLAGVSPLVDRVLAVVDVDDAVQIDRGGDGLAH